MRDEWALVKSEDELRPGMCVELRPCMTTGKRERFLLLRPETRKSPCPACVACRGWKTSASFGALCKALACIPERRLYRLRDDDTAADETATTRRKERVR